MTETKEHTDIATSGERTFPNSEKLTALAKSVIPQGVSSAARAVQRPVPIVVDKAMGARIVDADGNEYIDYVMGYGPLILGHSPSEVNEAIKNALDQGLRAGFVHRGEAELAQQVVATLPSAEMATFLSSGTEAVQLALRVARGGTGRSKIIKFRGHYHGWADGVFIANAGGGDSASTGGTDPLAFENTILLNWGDEAGLEKALTDDVAGVIMEPIAINAGGFEASRDYLRKVEELTANNGSYFILDEIITGYRVGLGGMQEIFGLKPDLTVLAKALGAGLPISALTGTREAFEPLITNKVSHRGTYNANPIAIAAAQACLGFLRRNADTVYPRMAAQSQEISDHLNHVSRKYGADIHAHAVANAIFFYSAPRPVSAIEQREIVDMDRTFAYAEDLLLAGVNALPYGLMYVSTAHTDDDISQTLDAITRSIATFSAS